jgi:hypothetical protein
VNSTEAVRRRPWAALEVVLAGALVAWRFVAPTWHAVWLDLLFYLGLYWIFVALCPESKRGSAAAWVLMFLLLILYLRAQGPHMFTAVEYP